MRASAYHQEYYSRPEIIARERMRRGQTPFPVTAAPTDASRFLRFVKVSGECWNWAGNIKNDGYGSMWAASKRRKAIASRLAWELWNGPIPAGLFVCHHCDNPPCVRPSHLFLGTAADNAKDCSAKGRARVEGKVHRGMRNGRAKLTEDQVREIRRRRAAGEKLSSLSAAFGVSTTVINHIEKGKLWRSVA